MKETRQRRSIDEWLGVSIPAGESRDVLLPVGESYSGLTLNIPIHIRRGREEGPVVLVTAALHGDEINGTGAIRQLIQDEAFQPLQGAVILVPVLNLLGFDRHSRYLPDRRDLNRCFPGAANGSLASRMAHAIFDSLVSRSDWAIDLHTAAVRRTNYPTVRGDLSNSKVRKIAEAFGNEIVINNKGPQKSFRRQATLVGCPTIVVEGGEVWKVEPTIVETSVRGIKNVLRSLHMLDGKVSRPPYQLTIEKTKWIRAERGGFLQFHVSPGDIVEKGQPLTTNATLLGREHSVLESPFNAVVLGMTTLPSTSPGEPVCNLGRLPKGTRPAALRNARQSSVSLEGRIVEDLSSNVLVVDPHD